jgi:hypothetical protein
MPGTPAPEWEPDDTGRDVPAKMTVEDFRRRCLASFPKLGSEEHDGLIQGAIDAVYAMFSGVNTLWDMQPKQVWRDKTLLCYLLLVEWFITDLRPELSAAYASVDGLPLKERRVDGVDLKFETGFLQETAGTAGQDTLGVLKSNHFGRTALMMIRASAKRAMLRNRKIV